ncbi:MAG: HDOD domain-containing protein [bacterium]|nr:HDOD domain-containing protein [bacterium]
MQEMTVGSIEADRIQQLVGSISGLPALPAIALHLLEAAEDPNTSASDLATLISADPALATRLLRLANSAYYGFPRKIATVNLAVVVLGFDTVRDLCLSVLVTDCFFNETGELPFQMEQFWKHSLATAICARMVYKLSDASHSGDGFIAGLLHDVGKLFLAKYFPKEYTMVMGKVQNDGMPLLEAERMVFSATHPVAGAWLLDEWNLPVWLVESTRTHHQEVADEPSSKLAMAVTFSDLLVRKARIEGGPGVPTELSPELMSTLQLKKNVYGEPDYDAYLDKLQRELRRADDLFGTFQKLDGKK